jgi:putative phosphoribosyl transferase
MLSVREMEVTIPVGNIFLEGNLSVPENPAGIVLFAHGSGSSRMSPRNRYVAWVIQQSGISTFLFDLLTPDEEAEDAATGKHRFNIDLLSRRLIGATDWVRREPGTGKQPLGYFGASTGAAAALVAAAERPEIVQAVVSRGGRPDLAGPSLGRVKAPTLLIVGGRDLTVIHLNRTAIRELKVENDLTIVPGATHLFEEPGALEEVARLAVSWFLRYLPNTREGSYQYTGASGYGELESLR